MGLAVSVREYQCAYSHNSFPYLLSHFSQSWLRGRCRNIIPLYKLLEIDLDDFCMDSILSATLNKLDVEMCSGTFVSVGSSCKILPHA